MSQSSVPTERRLRSLLPEIAVSTPILLTLKAVTLLFCRGCCRSNFENKICGVRLDMQSFYKCNHAYPGVRFRKQRSVYPETLIRRDTDNRANPEIR